ncbi:MAG: SCO family protein [Bryobacteraceae bacterium]
MRRFSTIATVLLLSLAGSAMYSAQAGAAPDISGIGIEQELGRQVPLETQLLDESGGTVRLGHYFDRKPVVLVPVYFSCPMLCSQVLSGLVAAMRPLSMRPGQDFEIVALSFDPADTPQTARTKRAHYAQSYSSKAGTTGWHFLTGAPDSIRAVMDAVGFHYRWDEKNEMFLHASGIMLLTPEGHVSRYLYGVNYEPKDLKLGLIESSHKRIGSPVDQILLLCYHYDPRTGKYGATVLNTLRGAAILTLILLVLGMFFLWRRDLREYRNVTKEMSRT